MINTYRYSGEGEVLKDGKSHRVKINPRILITRFGAWIPVNITHPRHIQNKLKEDGKPIPNIATRAMIDTGASRTIITERVAKELNLVHTGYQKVVSVQDEQKRPVYYGFIVFPWGSGKEIPMIVCPLKMKGIECLIGRDILMHWHFNYNGADGSIVVCD